MIHPVFDQFSWSAPTRDDTWMTNPLGVRTRRCYDTEAGTAPSTHGPTPDNPIGLHEELFEWIDLLESVALAHDRYTMIELGAGYGRWIANAAAALRQKKIEDYRFIGVEAEPTHFRWLRENLRENHLDLARCRLLKSVVNADGKPAHLTVGDPASNYGQSIFHDDMRLISRVKRFVRGSRSATRQVSAVTLTTILAPLTDVDLIDTDIQGEEENVFAPALDILTRKVKRIHIGTHHVRAEDALRAQFGSAGWQCLNDYPSLSTQATPYGSVPFQDGVQTWINPAFSANS